MIVHVYIFYAESYLLHVDDYKALWICFWYLYLWPNENFVPVKLKSKFGGLFKNSWKCVPKLSVLLCTWGWLLSWMEEHRPAVQYRRIPSLGTSPMQLRTPFYKTYIIYIKPSNSITRKTQIHSFLSFRSGLCNTGLIKGNRGVEGLVDWLNFCYC